MPALTTPNLVAWSLQVAAIVLVGGLGAHAVRLQAPGVRLAWLRAVLAVCLALPVLQPLAVRPLAASGRTDLAVTVGAELPPFDLAPGSPSTRRGAQPRDAAASAGLRSAPTIAERWSTSIRAVVPFLIAAGILARLAWLAIGLLGLRRLRKGSPGLKPGTYVNGKPGLKPGTLVNGEQPCAGS